VGTHIYTDGYLVEMVVRAPAVAPPVCGWPLVVCVHGGGGSKAAVAGLATSLASNGYCTVAYDVRGQGPSMALNNPALYGKTTDSVRELIDLFEIMETAEAGFPDLIDFTVIGVTGYSQGGRHSWMAAVNSGRLPPPNPWRQAPFPVISCAIREDAAGPGFGLGPGVGIGHHQVQKIFGAGSTWYQPAQAAQMQAWILAEDYAAVANHQHVPALDPAVLLPACQTPIGVHVSYDDYRISTNGVLSAWQQLPAGLPKLLQGGTRGHNSPANDHDRALFNQTRLRWLDRFLKFIANGVDLTDPMRLAVTPDVVPTYRDNTSLWDFRSMVDVPAAGTVNRDLYLDSAGQLAAAAPPVGGQVALTHNVPAGMNILAYSAAPPSPTGLANTLSLSIYLQSYVFRVGHRVRLQLENLSIHRPPTGNGVQIRSVPAMQSSSVDIQFGAATPSRLSLPTVPFGDPRPLSYPLSVSASAPSNQRFAIHSSTARAGVSYLTLLSLAGTTPGTPIAGTGVTLPLNVDAMLLWVLANPNGGNRIAFSGFLDARGGALPGVTLAGGALPPAVVGTSVFAAALVDLGGGSFAATNPVEIPIIQ